MVSNSGVEHFGHISDIKPEEFDAVFAVNTRGQLLVAQQAYKHVSTVGRLIMLSSVSTQARGVANYSLYSGSKAAIEAFARCLAVVLAIGVLQSTRLLLEVSKLTCLLKQLENTSSDLNIGAMKKLSRWSQIGVSKEDGCGA